MRLKLPPAAVFVIAVILLYAGAWLFPGLSLAFAGQKVLTVLLLIAGGLSGAQAVLVFFQNKTTIDPRVPETATALVTAGVYRISRNPMYLGLLLLLLSVAIYLGTLTAAIVVPAFVWFMTEFQIKPEEEKLSEIFGEAYRDYLTRVRRWI